jgi:anti-sigma-K factor RskA
MSYTNELVDKFKELKGVASDYAAAKLLDIRPNRISNYRTLTSHADDRTAIMLADALGLDRLETIARINEDRATERSEKEFWRRIASAAVLALSLGAGVSGATQGADERPGSISHNSGRMHIM